MFIISFSCFKNIFIDIGPVSGTKIFGCSYYFQSLESLDLRVTGDTSIIYLQKPIITLSLGLVARLITQVVDLVEEIY